MADSYASFFEYCKARMYTVQTIAENVIINGETFNVNCYVYNKEVNTSKITMANLFSLCTAVNAATQVIIAPRIIVSGTNLIPPYRCKGIVLFCKDLVNNATISMKNRGAYATGQKVYLYKEEFVPAAGGAGGAAITSTAASATGNAGKAGTGRGTGGGASGGKRHKDQKVGAGAAGTSFSGGAGSGASSCNGDTHNGTNKTRQSAAAGANGGAGSRGAVWRSAQTSGCFSAGGAGNNPGSHAYGVPVTINSYTTTDAGTGGLLIIFAKDLQNNGTITAQGSRCPVASLASGNFVTTGGGGSGGGSVNLFYYTRTTGTVTATGIAGSGYGINGGKGGDGTVTWMQIPKNEWPYAVFLVYALRKVLTLVDGAWVVLEIHIKKKIKDIFYILKRQRIHSKI